MSKGLVSIKFAVPSGHLPGDYALLYANHGLADNVDWTSPASGIHYPLFPNNAGIYGYGHAPFGHFRFGHAHSLGTSGFGHLPFGHFPYGHGTAVITATTEVTECGEYKYGLALKKNSYNKSTDVLILDVA